MNSLAPRLMRLINLHHRLLQRRLLRNHLLERFRILDRACEPLVAQYVSHVREHWVIGAETVRHEAYDLAAVVCSRELVVDACE